jgi:facilitated trehalose transporter
MKLLRGSGYNCDDELNEIKMQNKSDSRELSVLEHLKEKATRKALFIILAQFFFFQFTGINAVLQYTTTIFIEAKINIEPGLASIFVVSSQIIGTSFSTILVDKFGRRVLMVVSTILMALCHLSIGGYFYVKNSGGDVDHLNYLPIVSLSMFEVAFGCRSSQLCSSRRTFLTKRQKGHCTHWKILQSIYGFCGRPAFP